MKYTSNDYEIIDKVALSLRIDYGFLAETIDIFELAKKVGIVLTPYSKLSSKKILVISTIPSLQDGFSIMKYKNGVLKSYTFYNDDVSLYRQRFTIAHEIKHFIFKELNPDEKQEDLANRFARYILAPTCMLMKYKDLSVHEAAFLFNISFDTARNALIAANNRIFYKHGKLRDY